MNKQYIILDLDNTIADDGWRISEIDWSCEDPTQRYHRYHSLSRQDNLGNEDLLATGLRPIIFTARPVDYRSITMEWLTKHKIFPEALIMRNKGDHRHSVQLKREMLHWLPEFYDIPWSAIKCAVDDRQDVVDMFRKHHIWAERRQIHDLCAYTKPTKETQA